MYVIMRMTGNADSAYAYIRSIINRDEGKVLGVCNDPETRHIVIYAEVNDPDSVDKGWEILIEKWATQ